MNFPKVVAIDLDGVIVDTYKIHVIGWKTILESYGIKANDEMFANYHGLPTKEALKKLLSEFQIAVEHEELTRLVIVKNAIRDEHIRDLAQQNVLPGVREIIHESIAVGAKLVCLATTTAAPNILAQVGLAARFDTVAYGPVLMPPKSQSPVYLLRLLDAYQNKPNECLFIDDGFVPVEKATAAGIPSLCVKPNLPVHLPIPHIRDLGTFSLEQIFQIARGVYPVTSSG